MSGRRWVPKNDPHYERWDLEEVSGVPVGRVVRQPFVGLNGVWKAITWPGDRPTVQTRHANRAEAMNAVDDRT